MACVLVLAVGCAIPRRDTAVNLSLFGGGPMPDGRLVFNTPPVLGKAGWPWSNEDVAGLPQHQRWPMVWRFHKESVQIVDDKGRCYDPGKSWEIGKLKPGGKFLLFDISPLEDAKEIRIEADLVINDRRFIIEEKYSKGPDGKWVNLKHAAPKIIEGAEETPTPKR